MPSVQAIPSPPAWPLLGNLPSIYPPSSLLTTFSRLASTYGEIFMLRLPGSAKRIFITSASLLAELCDENKFCKVVSGALFELRNATGAGLFTAHQGEKEWGIAHRILAPAFGPDAVRGMFDGMTDIASQLVLKWARHGPEYRIDPVEDFTRCALDTLGLCTMGYRFNSFYGTELHPFVDAMMAYMGESGRRATRPKIIQWLMTATKYRRDIETMRRLAEELVRARRRSMKRKGDLLDAMIHGVDPKTGGTMDDDLIMQNLITFLIAGHETNAGLLSFVFFHLIRNPSAYRAAQNEVDEVVGKGPVAVDHLSKLKYIAAVLRETLRLNPVATLFSVSSHPDLDYEDGPATLRHGKYLVEMDVPVVALLTEIHRDRTVYGDDVDEFRPERMLDENFDKLPSGAWKAFGIGKRACLGRSFAWQESLLVTALLLKNFDFHDYNPGYELQIKQTLTIKPEGFYMRATLRDGVDPVALGVASVRGM